MPSVPKPNRTPGWLLHEAANAGRENLDADHVSRYDGKEDAGAADEVLVLQRAGLTGESVVVELGAGTGQFAIAVAPMCGRVVAADVSPVMLRALRAKIDGARLDNIEVVQAGFLTYEHQGSPADFVYSRYALHHLPDFWKAVALARIHQVLRPGGVLRVCGTSCTASTQRRRGIVSKPGAPPARRLPMRAGAEVSLRNMFVTSTRLTPGFSSR